MPPSPSQSPPSHPGPSHPSRPPGASACPCQSGLAYAQCCGPLHAGAAAATAQALMRSRYSAFVLADAEYLLATWHPSTRPPTLDFGDVGATRWLGLEVRRAESTGADSAVVEFVARSRHGGGPAQRLHEVSRFLREDGRWYYLDGEFPPAR